MVNSDSETAQNTQAAHQDEVVVGDAPARHVSAEKTRFDPLPAPVTLRHAFDMAEAMAHLSDLPKLGHCPTYEVSMYKSMEEEQRAYNDDHQDIDQDALRELVKNFEDALVFEELREFHDNYTRRVATGAFSKPFRLRVTLPGCSLDDHIPFIEPLTEYSKRAKGPVDDLVKQWYRAADAPNIPGAPDGQQSFGREIPASGFVVEPELLERIAQCWDENFIARRGVRVVPHKIHLYQGNEQFRAHGGAQDSEDGLLATFLVGLGSHGAQDSNVKILHGCYHRFCPGAWCAVDSTLGVTDALYRAQTAIMSFKLYRTEAGPSRSVGPAHLRKVVADGMARLALPCGILLDKAHVLGPPSVPSGLDAVVWAELSARTDAAVRVVPVVLTLHASWGRTARKASCGTTVCPFTQEHLDVLLRRRAADTLREAHPWLEGLGGVPFYCVDFKRASVTWKDDKDEYDGAYDIGESIYFAYAVLLLPLAA